MPKKWELIKRLSESEPTAGSGKVTKANYDEVYKPTHILRSQ